MLTHPAFRSGADRPHNPFFSASSPDFFHLTRTHHPLDLKTMWRRFSTSSTESSSPPKQPTNNQPPPPPPSTPVSATPKSATSLAEHQPQLTKPQTNPSVVTKEHELASQKPAGAGQRRRSSLLERLTRESTKEGMT